jgi:hypothetical protein
MSEITDRIKQDAEQRVFRSNDGNQDVLLYLDNKVMQAGESINIVTEQIEFDQPIHVVFVDDEPGKNFAHRCHYLLYNAENGEFIRKIRAEFPHFLFEKPETLELFRASNTGRHYERKKKE